MNVAYCK